MANFAIRPRRYWDPLDAIRDKLLDHEEKGHVIDIGKNPNGKIELLAWSLMEIQRLRDKCGEKPPERNTRVMPGPRPVGESKPIIVEGE